jgi:hypothetical protein
MDNRFDRIAFRSRLNRSPNYLKAQNLIGATCSLDVALSLFSKFPARQRIIAKYKVSLHFLQRLLSLLSLFALLTDTLQATAQTYDFT